MRFATRPAEDRADTADVSDSRLFELTARTTALRLVHAGLLASLKARAAPEGPPMHAKVVRLPPLRRAQELSNPLGSAM